MIKGPHQNIFYTRIYKGFYGLDSDYDEEKDCKNKFNKTSSIIFNDRLRASFSMVYRVLHNLQIAALVLPAPGLALLCPSPLLVFHTAFLTLVCFAAGKGYC